MCAVSELNNYTYVRMQVRKARRHRYRTGFLFYNRLCILLVCGINVLSEVFHHLCDRNAEATSRVV